MVVDVLVTKVDVVPFSGLSSYYAAAVATMVSAETITDATTAACGLSCYSSAAADVAATMADAASAKYQSIVFLKGGRFSGRLCDL